MTSPRTAILEIETKSSSSNSHTLNKMSLFANQAPSLTELAIIEIINQHGSVEDVKKFIENNQLCDHCAPNEKQAIDFINSGLLDNINQDIVEILKKIKLLHQYVEENKIKDADELLSSTSFYLLPVLLQTKSTVVTSAQGNRNHIIIRGTALMMALGAEAGGSDKNMVEMLTQHIKRALSHEESEKEIAKQTLEQFPEEWDEDVHNQYEKDYGSLIMIRQAIADSKTNDDPTLKTAFEEFRRHLEPEADTIIEKGKYGNARLLQTALDLGYSNFFYDWRKDHLYYTQVVSWILRLEPTNRKQEIAKWLNSNLESGKKSTQGSDSEDQFFDSWVNVYYSMGFKAILRLCSQISVYFKTRYAQKQEYFNVLLSSHSDSKVKGLIL